MGVAKSAASATECLTRTPREFHESAKVRSAHVVGRAFADVNIAVAAVARALGVSTQLIAQMVDPEDSQKNFRLADWFCLPPLAKRRLIELLAEDIGCALVDVPADDASVGDLQLAADAQREHSEAACAFGGAVADGKFSTEDADQLERQSLESVNQNLRSIARARSVRAARGRSVR